MLAMIRAEQLKMRHTFGGSLPVAAVLLTLGLVFGLAHRNPYYSVNAWNWWYVMLLPGMVSILCHLGMKREKKMHYCNLFSLPFSSQRCFAGKIVFYSLGLSTANLVMAIGTFIADIFWGSYIPLGNEFVAAFVLNICFLWEIPLFMLLSVRFGIFVCLFSGMVLSIGATAVIADGDLWWICPAAIPVRLMCPVLGIMPNGLLVSEGSPLWDTSVILPGIIICLVWFVVFTGVCFTALTMIRDSSSRRGLRKDTRL